MFLILEVILAVICQGSRLKDSEILFCALATRCLLFIERNYVSY